MRDLTVERVRELYDYNPDTGLLTRRPPYQRGSHPWKVVGSLHKDGGRHVTVDGRSYKAHRLIWFIVYGDWPIGVIDHINGVRDDNRLANLRDVAFAENAKNIKRRVVGPHPGYLGVYLEKGTGMFQSHLEIDGVRCYLGRYLTADEAYAAYRFASNNHRLSVRHPRFDLGACRHSLSMALDPEK